MRDRLRNFDSKITFFAFADIITAVSGMLIFITLLLATDLGRPTDSRSQAADAELQRQLQETLAQQAAVDAENRGLQNILTTANTAPAPEKLESDISRLRDELAQEKSKHAGLAEQLAASKSTLEERDKTLGITALRTRIEDGAEKLAALAREDAKIREETVALEDQISNVQAKTVKLRSREGQLWLIPDRATTSKEPLLAVVSGIGVRVERFDQPDQAKVFSKSDAHSGFESLLRNAKPASQYVVFLIRPSGIGVFKDTVQIAREKGFEVGFDALEENKEVHFTRPPPIDDQAVATMRPQRSPGGPQQPGTASSGGASGTDTTNQPGGKIPGASGNSTTSSEKNGTTSETNGTASGTNTAASLTNVTGSATNTTGASTNIAGSVTNGSPSSTNTSTTAPAPPPKPKSWWQRFLEWIGIG